MIPKIWVSPIFFLYLYGFWYNNSRHGIAFVSYRNGNDSRGGISVVSLETPKSWYDWSGGASY